MGNVESEFRNVILPQPEALRDVAGVLLLDILSHAGHLIVEIVPVREDKFGIGKVLRLHVHNILWWVRVGQLRETQNARPWSSSKLHSQVLL